MYGTELRGDVGKGEKSIVYTKDAVLTNYE